MKTIVICLFLGFLSSVKAHSQDSEVKEVAYKTIAEGVDSPIPELQVVCFNKYFNRDYLLAEFRKRYNLDEKSLYKNRMLIEIFHSDKNKTGLDKIELIGIKENDRKFIIDYNLINSNTDNDDKKLSPFLIVQMPKSKKEITFIFNGTELRKQTEIYLD